MPTDQQQHWHVFFKCWRYYELYLKSQVWTKYGPCWFRGNSKGFFRIPQVKTFLSSMSRQLNNDDIAQLATVVTENKEFEGALPLLRRLGEQLVRLYELRQGPSKSLTSSRDKLRLSNAPTLARINLPTTPAISLSPAICEFIRFIVISADSKAPQRPDEVLYFRDLKKDP